jgi:hypothetical protein
LAEPVAVDKGGQIKISSSKLEGIMLSKRFASEYLNERQIEYKRRKLEGDNRD